MRRRPLTEATKFVRASVGLHPQLVRSHAREIDLIQPLLERTRYVGEIGIDYSEPDRNDHAHQRRIFGRILEYCAAAGDKVLTIHSRRAASEVISMAQGHGISNQSLGKDLDA
jgi:TatD DNase family protein